MSFLSLVFINKRKWFKRNEYKILSEKAINKVYTHTIN